MLSAAAQQSLWRATTTHILNRYKCDEHIDPLNCHAQRNLGRRASSLSGVDKDFKEQDVKSVVIFVLQRNMSNPPREMILPSGDSVYGIEV